MVHFLQKAHLLEVCENCKTDISSEEWKSEFYIDIHYKTTICPKCNNKQRVTVTYEGSGHDDWNLEKRIA